MVEVDKLNLYLKRGYEVVIDKNVDCFSGFLLTRSNDRADLQDFDGNLLLFSFPNIMSEIEKWGLYLHIIYCEETQMLQSRIQRLGSSGFYLEEIEDDDPFEFEMMDENLLLSLAGLEEQILKRANNFYPRLKKGK